MYAPHPPKLEGGPPPSRVLTNAIRLPSTLHSETTKDRVFDRIPPISSFSVWLPTVPAAKVPSSVKLPTPSVLRQSVISQDLPLLVPRRRMEVFGTPLLNFNFQVSPTQCCAKSSEITGWPGRVCRAATPYVRHKSIARGGRSFCSFITKPRRDV